MFNTYIGIILSILVIFALLSILVSLLNEIYRNFMRDRGKMMYSYVHRMLADEKNLDLAYLVYRHPLIENSRKDERHVPAYIDPKIFAMAFIQTIGELSSKVKYTRNETDNYDKTEVRETDPIVRFKLAVDHMHHTPLKTTLQGMVERAQCLKPEERYNSLETQVVDWFNYQMNVLTQTYQHRQRKSLLFFGALVTLMLNIDSFHLVHELKRDPALRASITAKADVYALRYEQLANQLEALEKDAVTTGTQEMQMELSSLIYELRQTKKEIDELELPIGYSKASAPLSWFYTDNNDYASSYERRRNLPTFIGVMIYLFGLLISAISLSLGAPFWFDLLNKAVNLKRGGK